MKQPKDYWFWRRLAFFLVGVIPYIILLYVGIKYIIIDGSLDIQWRVITLLGLLLISGIIMVCYYITAILFDMKPNIVKFFHTKNKS